MTTTGPLEWSGVAAGVSVEGPMASVSLRLRFVGGDGFEAAAAGVVLSSGCACDMEMSTGTGPGFSVAGAVGFAVASGEDTGSVLISIGLVESASSGVAVGCAALAEGGSEGEVMATGQRGTSDCVDQASGLHYCDSKRATASE
jgi:hypothetical protein